MKTLISLVIYFFPIVFAFAQESTKLSGTVIGSTWAGLDLGKQNIITKVRFTPPNETNGAQRIVLGLFEGANREDFLDAVPIYMVKSAVAVGKWGEASVNVSKGFRYVRFVARNNAQCNIAQLEFYGYEGEGDESMFYTPTNLPLVNIHVENAVDPVDKVNDLVADIQIISDNGAKRMEAPGTTRLRGNASMDFPKKPYRIKFDVKQNVLDAPAKAKKWTLISNYGDKTLIRNLIAFEISRRVGIAFTPYGRLVDVIFNSEYKGTYQLCDQVEVGTGRVETDGYFVEIDAYAEGEDNYFWSKKRNPVTVKYPDAEDISAEQNAYIKEQFDKMEAAVYAIDVNKKDNAFRNYLDLNSFIRHFLVGELSGNTDTYWSTYMVKHLDDEKFYTGPVWDFDLAFENDYRTYPINSLNDYVFATKGSVAGDMKTFVARIIREAAVQQDLKDLWSVLRYTGAISAASLESYIDQLVSEINASQKLNFTRWGILNQKVHMNYQALGNYTAEVNNVKRYLRERIEWLDKKLSYDATGISQITFGQTSDKDYKIYNMAGNLLRVSSESMDLKPGVYIIKYGDKARKVIVK